MNPLDVNIQTLPEWLLGEEARDAISELLQASFEGYPEETISIYQKPSMRLLAYYKEQLIGHTAIDYRFIASEGKKYPVLGLTDFCVLNSFQDAHVGKAILEEVEKLSTATSVDFVLLNATNPRFYEKNGYQVVSNSCRWLLINNGVSMGVLRRSLKNSLAVKAVGQSPWPKGEIDFLGHMI